jgi:hypothetical protein
MTKKTRMTKRDGTDSFRMTKKIKQIPFSLPLIDDSVLTEVNDCLTNTGNSKR